VAAWYFHSTSAWLIVMRLATAICFSEPCKLKKQGVDINKVFGTLPPE